MKVYTKTGDKGTTSLVGGKRVPKDSPRLESYGTIDELNSWIGLIAANTTDDTPTYNTLINIQHRLFDIGAALATEPESKWQPQPFATQHTTHLETEIDRMEKTLPAHNQFILPGGTQTSAYAQIARTIARRAERRILTLTQTQNIDTQIIPYINRLSDYLFVLARHLNIKNRHPEIFWQKNL